MRERVVRERNFNGTGRRFIGIQYRDGFLRKFPTKVNQPRIDSFMFFGYPENWEVKDLWSLFKRHGWVTDIYMVKWRLKSGERFGFVRFRGVSDAKLMEKRLGNINIGNMKLKVFIASDRRRKNAYHNEKIKGNFETARQTEVKQGAWRDGRSYRDVLHKTKGVIEKPTAGMSGSGSCSKVVDNRTTEDIAQAIVEIEVENGRIEYLKKCVFGEVGEVESLDLAKSRLEADGLEVEDIKLLGNLDIMIKFKNERTVENVLKNKSLDVHQWLSNARKWVAGFSPDRRLVWLNIMGVPVEGWSEKTFIKIAEKWGKTLETSNCNLDETSILVAGKVLVQTKHDGIINETSVVKLNGKEIYVTVEEDRTGLFAVDRQNQVDEENICTEAYHQPLGNDNDDLSDDGENLGNDGDEIEDEDEDFEEDDDDEFWLNGEEDGMAKHGVDNTRATEKDTGNGNNGGEDERKGEDEETRIQNSKVFSELPINVEVSEGNFGGAGKVVGNTGDNNNIFDKLREIKLNNSFGFGNEVTSEWEESGNIRSNGLLAGNGPNEVTIETKTKPNTNKVDVLAEECEGPDCDLGLNKLFYMDEVAANINESYPNKEEIFRSKVNDKKENKSNEFTVSDQEVKKDDDRDMNETEQKQFEVEKNVEGRQHSRKNKGTSIGKLSMRLLKEKQYIKGTSIVKEDMSKETTRSKLSSNGGHRRKVVMSSERGKSSSVGSISTDDSSRARRIGKKIGFVWKNTVDESKGMK